MTTEPDLEGSIGVTVILVTYNHERYIRESVESVLMQEVSFPLQIIVTEDRSTDSTFEIVESLSLKYPDRIELMRSPTNLANQDVSTRAILASKGKYIASLDGDDYWVSKEKLQRQFDFMEANPDCAICYHDVARVTETGEVIRIMEGPRGRVTIDDLIMGNFIPTCSSFIRRSAIESPPAWLRDLEAGDWPFYMVAAQSGWIGHVEGVLAHYRIHGGALWSTQPLVEQWIRSLSMLSEMEVHLGEHHRAAFLRSRKNIIENAISALDRSKRLSEGEVQQFEQEQVKTTPEEDKIQRELQASAEAAERARQISEEAEQRLKAALERAHQAELRASSAEVVMREARVSAQEATRKFNAAEEKLNAAEEWAATLQLQLDRIYSTNAKLLNKIDSLEGNIARIIAENDTINEKLTISFRNIRRIRNRERLVTAILSILTLAIAIKLIVESLV